MKQILIIGLVGAAAYLIYRGAKEKKLLSPKCGCNGAVEETIEEKLAETATVTGGPASAVEHYDASPKAIFPTPDRLIVASSWPNDNPQEFARY